MPLDVSPVVGETFIAGPGVGGYALKTLLVNPVGTPSPWDRPINPSVLAIARIVMRILPSKNISTCKLLELVVPYAGTLCHVTTARSVSCLHEIVPAEPGFKSRNKADILGLLK